MNARRLATHIPNSDGYGSTIFARVGSGLPSLVWKISPKNPNTFNFFPSGQKNLFGLGQKVSWSKTGILQSIAFQECSWVNAMLTVDRMNISLVVIFFHFFMFLTQSWVEPGLPLIDGAAIPLCHYDSPYLKVLQTIMFIISKWPFDGGTPKSHRTSSTQNAILESKSLLQRQTCASKSPFLSGYRVLHQTLPKQHLYYVFPDWMAISPPLFVHLLFFIVPSLYSR